MSLKVVIPEQKHKIQKQIEALEWSLSQDINDKDKKIHQEALSALKEALEALEAIENTPSKAGRKKVIPKELVQECKAKGMTQMQTAIELNVSIPTVQRNWN